MKGDRIMPNRRRFMPTRCLPPTSLTGILIALMVLTGCTLPPPPTTLPSVPLTPLPPAAGDEMGTERGDEMAERVEFDLGTSTATVSGTLGAGGEVNYALAASTGQTVTIETSGTAAPVATTVQGPGSASWSGTTTSSAAGDTTMVAQYTAPTTGDYLVTLAAPDDGAETDYTATFTVMPNAVTRIAFPAGTTVTERSSMLPSGEGTQQFLLAGNAGWTLTVDATSDGAPLSMTIADPAGMQRIPEMQATDTGYAIGHQFALPIPGYYLVTLAKGDHSPSTTYTVTFTLEAED
jgi:hypothetical protein